MQDTSAGIHWESHPFQKRYVLNTDDTMLFNTKVNTITQKPPHSYTHTVTTSISIRHRLVTRYYTDFTLSIIESLQNTQMGAPPAIPGFLSYTQTGFNTL